MLDEAVVGEGPLEVRDGASPRDHEVLADNLEPVDLRRGAEHVLVVRNTQADTDAEIGQAEAGQCGRVHVCPQKWPKGPRVN